MANENDIIARLKVEGVEKFKADIEGSVASTKKLQTSVKDTGDTGSDAFDKMGKSVDDTKAGVDELAKSTASYKSQLKTMQTEIVSLTMELHDMRDAGKSGTKEFDALDKKIKEITNKAGNLKDALADASDVIKNAGSDTRGLDKALRSVTTLASGFQVVEGATALFGAKSEDLQKALVRLNAVMSVTQGLQQIQNELTKNDSIFTGALTKAKSALNFVIGEGSIALKGFRLALASIGIGAVITLIYELVTNWDKLKSIIVGTSLSAEDYGKKLEKVNEIEKVRLENNKKYYDYLVAIGKLTEAQSIEKQIADQKRLEDKRKTDLESQKKLLGDINQEFKASNNYKNDGLTQAELDIVRSKQKNYTLKDQQQQQKIVTKAEQEYQQSVIKRVALEKQLTDLKKKNEPKKGAESNVAVPEFKIKDLQFPADYEKALNDQISFLTTAIKNAIGEGIPVNDPTLTMLKLNLDAKLQELQDYKDKIDLLFSTSGDKNADWIMAGLTGELPAQPTGETEPKLTLFDRLFGTYNTNKQKAENLLGIIQEVNQIGGQIGDIANQVITRRSDQELQKLENQRKSGLISQQQFEKKSADIKNESARKQRAVEVALALAKVPEAILSAYISALSIPVIGTTLAPILAGVAGAFATAQVALIASAPLPKFRYGGSIAKKLGFIQGKKHEQGGVPIEVEGGEYVIKSQAVKTYGVKMLDNINNMKFNPVINAGDKLKSQRNRDYKLNENLATISSYLKQNYRIDSQGNFILSEIRDAVKSNRKAYV
jgi:hypothetical protein